MAATAEAAGVELSGAAKAFRRDGRRTVAFARLDLRVEPGELLCLLGPSGCGKSTLLRVLAGTLDADEGVVLAGGAPVSGPAADRGMLFQSPMLFPWLTTRGNVLFGPHAQRSRGLDRRPPAEIEADVDAILETVGLAGFAEAYPHELSGGMRHRAAFARAVATRPSVLLMDEPFGALDAITRLRMQAFLLDMWERYGMTILFVTHDIEEAIVLGDRVAIMGDGRILDVVDLELERPRDADGAEFAAIRRRVRTALGL